MFSGADPSARKSKSGPVSYFQQQKNASMQRRGFHSIRDRMTRSGRRYDIFVALG